jgi:hypothetical protein
VRGSAPLHTTTNNKPGLPWTASLRSMELERQITVHARCLSFSLQIKATYRMLSIHLQTYLRCFATRRERRRRVPGAMGSPPHSVGCSCPVGACDRQLTQPPTARAPRYVTILDNTRAVLNTPIHKNNHTLSQHVRYRPSSALGASPRQSPPLPCIRTCICERW